MANAILKETCVNLFATNKWMTHNKVHHVEKMSKGSNMYNTNPICKAYFSKLCYGLELKNGHVFLLQCHGTK
jgi:hypothetical protein